MPSTQSQLRNQAANATGNFLDALSSIGKAVSPKKTPKKTRRGKKDRHRAAAKPPTRSPSPEKAEAPPSPVASPEAPKPASTLTFLTNIRLSNLMWLLLPSHATPPTPPSPS